MSIPDFSTLGLPNNKYLKQAYALATQVAEEKNAVEVVEGSPKNLHMLNAIEGAGKAKKMRWMIIKLLGTAYVCSGGVEVCGSGVCDPDKDPNVAREVFRIGKLAGIDQESLQIMATGQGLKNIEVPVKDWPTDIAAVESNGIVSFIDQILQDQNSINMFRDPELRFVTDGFNEIANNVSKTKLPKSLYAQVQSGVKAWNKTIVEDAPAP